MYVIIEHWRHEGVMCLFLSTVASFRGDTVLVCLSLRFVHWHIFKVVVHDYTCRYGTPYLLSLGLSKEMTALIWLSGPISGKQ